LQKWHHFWYILTYTLGVVHSLVTKALTCPRVQWDSSSEQKQFCQAAHPDVIDDSYEWQQASTHRATAAP